MKHEIFFNEKTQTYTLEKEGNIKKIPLKYKPQDSTRRFRIEKIKEKLGTIE